MSSSYAFNYPFNITGNCKTDTSTLHRWSEAVSAKTLWLECKAAA